jgi:hypothetical protein
MHEFAEMVEVSFISREKVFGRGERTPIDGEVMV